MEILQTNLQDVLLIKPKVFRDTRGFFLESYSQRTFLEHGIATEFLQDNHAFSEKKGVLRGLHFQMLPHSQTKLVRVTRGAVYDVAVDLRKDSRTFGKWQGFELTASNFYMVYIPQGFAHGYCTLEDATEFMYKNDTFYAPDYEAALRWNDPTLKITWPITEPILSEKDAHAPLFKDFKSPF
jgi:dTDP-4-dehydrorhamnose 3,5-epimerase